MRIVKVESIPETKYGKSRMNLHKLLDDFLKSNMEYAHVVLEDGDYSRPEYARIALIAACRRYGYGIRVISRNGLIYLAKRGV